MAAYKKSGTSASLSDRTFLFPEQSRRYTMSEVEGWSLSGAEGRKNLSHSSKKSRASAPLNDRIFLFPERLRNPDLSEVEGANFCSLSYIPVFP